MSRNHTKKQRKHRSENAQRRIEELRASQTGVANQESEVKKPSADVADERREEVAPEVAVASNSLVAESEKAEREMLDLCIFGMDAMKKKLAADPMFRLGGADMRVMRDARSLVKDEKEAEAIDTLELELLKTHLKRAKERLFVISGALLTGIDTQAMALTRRIYRERIKRAEERGEKESGVRGTESGVEEKTENDGLTQRRDDAAQSEAAQNAGCNVQGEEKNQNATGVMPAEAGIQSPGNVVAKSEDKNRTPASRLREVATAEQAAGMTQAPDEASSPHSSAASATSVDKSSSSLCAVA